jgi:hypothetical protein
MLRKDEAALFELANGFSIRHNRSDQKSLYDKEIWLDWAFHVYLATVRAVTQIMRRHAEGEEEAAA